MRLPLAPSCQSLAQSIYHEALSEYAPVERALTIIKNTASLPFYPITVVPVDVQELMQRSFDTLSGTRIMKMKNLIKVFDAYCHVTSTPITFLSLSSPSFLRVAQGFLGAFDDNSLIPAELPTRLEYQRTFVKMMQKMREEVPMLPELTITDTMPGVHQHVWNGMKRDLDPVALRYWNGWEVRGRNGNNGYLPIAHLWNSHGPEFAELVYDRYTKDAVKKLNPTHTDIRSLIHYLVDNKEQWPTSTFQNPVKVNQLFIDFMLHNFLKAVEDGTNINNRTHSYSTFIHTMEEVFIQPGIWARPFSGSLPKPGVKVTPGTKTNLKKKADGTIVKNKLITEVPLHLTDSEAIEILFKNINEDNALVLKWARCRLQKAKEAYENCIKMAKYGSVIEGGNYNATKIEQIGAENICATYLSKGVTHLKQNFREIFGRTPKGEVFDLLGIPTIDTIFALQMMLTHGHPTITDGFLVNLELYNKKGILTGFTKTEKGRYQLLGYKDRAQGPNSERKILLSDEEAEWVKLMITMTTVLREELKQSGDDRWRYLFLHTSGAITTPNVPSSVRLNQNTIVYQRRMVDEFMELGNRGETATKRFITQLSVTAFRASAAVEIFLREHDVEEMAKALGHKGYTSTLLSRYLPEPILAFFQTRWIRLFQRGIICYAMKDSPRLLEVTRFADMNELHAFLEKHALKEIPEHLQNPDYLKTPTAKPKKSESKKADQVVVSIDTGVLTALLSLHAAVTNAQNKEFETQQQSAKQLCAKAVYWSRFSELVVNEIEDRLDSTLQGHLAEARKHANAAHMEELIYVNAIAA